MIFFKGNWFKIVIIIILGYGVVVMSDAYENYPRVQAYQQMRFKTFELCMDTRIPFGATSDDIKSWSSTCNLATQ